MVCRRLPHLLRDMPVHIQSEACRRVAEVCLYGFDVVAAFNRNHGVAVPQIVKAQPVQPDLTDDILEVVVDGEVAEVRAELIGEHQIPRVIPLSWELPFVQLSLLVSNLNEFWTKRQNPGQFIYRL